MGEKVILDEGGSVSIHTRIKDMCKEARNRQGLTNQAISNMISERFGIEDFSVNTVNNFFSERSKATTIYTTGYICAVLDISIDAVFGIEQQFTTDEELEFVRQLQKLKVDAKLQDQKIQYLENTIKEKDERISQAHQALENYRSEISKNSSMIPRGAFFSVLSLCIVSIISLIVCTALF